MSTISAETQLSSLLSQRGRHAPEQPISRLMSLALANPEAISLAAGFVDNATLPTVQTAEACARIFADAESGRAALQYGSNVGDGDLRQWIANRHFSSDSEARAHSMILTAGSNQFLQLVSECLLDPGDIVLCAAPTYFVYLYVLRDLAARAWGIATDQEGMNPEEIDLAMRKIDESGELSRVKALYVVPYFDNPAGTTMSAARRRRIIEVLDRWSRRTPIMMLVDNAYRDLRYDGGDVPCMTDLGADPRLTIETGTFSKNLSPGIRVGWGVPPAPLHEAMERRKSVVDFGSPHLNQILVRTLMGTGKFDQHLGVLCQAYRAKRDAMVEACDEYFGSVPGVEYRVPAGGLYVWLKLPDGTDAGPQGTLWESALKAGVMYVPGGYFYPPEGHPICHNTARLSFGVQPPARIREGIRILANAVHRDRKTNKTGVAR